MKYFLDTYAILEIIKGNPNYKSYLNKEYITLKVNLAELSYALLKIGEECKVKHFFNLYSKIAVDTPSEIIIEAMKFRFKNKEKKLSYIDCFGYIYAKKYGYRFLTGDKGFEGFSDVEYVK